MRRHGSLDVEWTHKRAGATIKSGKRTGIPNP